MSIMGFSKIFEISSSYPWETWRNPIFETPKISENSDNFARKRDIQKKRKKDRNRNLWRSLNPKELKKKFPTQNGDFQKKLVMLHLVQCKSN